MASIPRTTVAAAGTATEVITSQEDAFFAAKFLVVELVRSAPTTLDAQLCQIIQLMSDETEVPSNCLSPHIPIKSQTHVDGQGRMTIST